MDHTLQTKTDTTHALLIGVDDYRSFNGTSDFDLKGSRNDVLLLATYCVEVLLIHPRNISVLTTPPLTAQEREPYESLRDVHWGDAREKEVTRHLASLLHVSKKGTALLAFSGHGSAFPDGEPVICLGDTAPRLEHGVLALKTLGDDIKKAGAGDRLIALFDCCHVASPPTDPKRRTTSLPSFAATADVESHGDLFNVSDRVFLAARPGKQGYQMRLGKLWHGALTFALVTAADRWQCVQEISHGSYKNVLKRAKRTVKALGVAQKPEFRVPESKSTAIRKEPFLGVSAGWTVRKPDALQDGMQLDPNYLYTIFVGSATRGWRLLAQIAATGTTPVYVIGSTTALLQNTEYWYVNASALADLGSSSNNISIKATALAGSITLDTSVSYEFNSAEAAVWSSTLAPPTSGTSYVFSGMPADPTSATAYVLLNIPSSGTLSLTGMQWYLTGLLAQPSSRVGYLNPGNLAGITYSRATLPTSGYWAAPSR